VCILDSEGHRLSSRKDRNFDDKIVAHLAQSRLVRLVTESPATEWTAVHHVGTRSRHLHVFLCDTHRVQPPEMIAVYLADTAAQVRGE